MGHGQVGAIVSSGLIAAGVPFLAVEAEPALLVGLKARGIETIEGNGGEQAILDRLNIPGARCLITAIPDAFEAGHVIESARAANPAIHIVARAHSTESVAYLKSLGADDVLTGQEEIAQGMLRTVLAAQPGAGV